LAIRQDSCQHIPDEIRAEISTAYESLSKQSDTNNLGVAVEAVQARLTVSKFCRTNGVFLNISVLINYLMLYMSPYLTNRAIKYRHDMGFLKLDIAISVG
jgi:pyruvate,water dikinase